MKLLVDTSVWSLALRRDRPPDVPQIAMLAHALEAGELVVTTGLVLQELLQGFRGPKAARRIGTIDALIAALCIRHGLTLLTTDRDFEAVAAHASLTLRKP